MRLTGSPAFIDFPVAVTPLEPDSMRFLTITAVVMVVLAGASATHAPTTNATNAPTFNITSRPPTACPSSSPAPVVTQRPAPTGTTNITKTPTVTTTSPRGSEPTPTMVPMDPRSSTPPSTSQRPCFDVPRTTAPSGGYTPSDPCIGKLRNTLLTYCAPSYCPQNGACVAYDPISQPGSLSGCDYDLASAQSFCTVVNGRARTCHFQCFPTFEPRSQFKFFIPFKTALSEPIPRQPYRNDGDELKTTETPFLSNSILAEIGVLNLTSIVTEVFIAGGRSEKGTPGRLADLAINPKLLSKSPSVNSLTLQNIDLSKSDLADILTSAPTVLKSLDLRNTNLRDLPDRFFGNLQQLVTLTLAQNSLSSVDTGSATLSKLSTLDLSQNALTTITVEASSLKNLDLSGNNLVRIPLSVFSLTGLETLNLKGNPISSPLVLSPSQQAFLDSLSEFLLEPVANPGTPDLPPSATVIPIDLGGGVVINGSVAVIGGVTVITVDEPIADQYNTQLQEKQKESRPQPREQATADTDSTTSPPISSALNATGLSTDNASVSKTSSQEGSSDIDIDAGSNKAAGSYTSEVGSDPRTTQDKKTTPASKTDQDTATNSSGLSLSTKLMLGGLGSAFVVAVIVCLLIIAKRRKRNAQQQQQSSYLAMVDRGEDEAHAADTQTSGSVTLLPWWKDDDMLSHRLNAGDIGDQRVIGSGGSGVVWLVNYRGGSRQLVSKRVIQSEGAAYDAKVMALFAEAKIASSLRYPSIVPFVGVAWTDKTDLQVLYEYMPNGDLGSYLARTSPATLPWMSQKLQLAVDIIEALVYAHSFNPPLLHRDLKSSNVLLDKKMKAKLGDFGSARPESDSNTMTTNEIGTGRWLAPEILLGSTSYGASSDIYSFGVVLCELDTHQVPYADEAQAVSSESQLLQRVANGELRPTVSASCPEEIRDMAEACMAFDPAERPTAMQVSYKLRSLLRQNQQK